MSLHSFGIVRSGKIHENITLPASSGAGAGAAGTGARTGAAAAGAASVTAAGGFGNRVGFVGHTAGEVVYIADHPLRESLHASDNRGGEVRTREAGGA